MGRSNEEIAAEVEAISTSLTGPRASKLRQLAAELRGDKEAVKQAEARKKEAEKAQKALAEAEEARAKALAEQEAAREAALEAAKAEAKGDTGS